MPVTPVQHMQILCSLVVAVWCLSVPFLIQVPVLMYMVWMMCTYGELWHKAKVLVRLTSRGSVGRDVVRPKRP